MPKLSKRRLLARALLLIVLAVLASFLFINRTQSDAREKTFATLSEISEQCIARLHLELNKTMEKLVLLADIIEAEPALGADAMLQHLEPLATKYGFVRIGLADSAGDMATTDGVTFDILDRSYFQKALQGERSVSGALDDKAGEGKVIVYAVPVFSQGAVRHVLFCTYSIENYTKALATPSFSGEGYSYIVTSSGACVVGSDRPDSVGHDFSNLFDAYIAHNKKNRAGAEQMRTAMAAGKSGGATIHLTAEKLVYYQPVGVNDWYLITVVPAAVVMRETNEMLLWSYLLILACTAVVVLLVLDSLRTRLVSYRELENAAYVDALTGGATFLKFSRDVAPTLANHPHDNFAMISLDIDNFQYINDVYGYDEGDSALRFLWNNLCLELAAPELCARVNSDHFVCLARYERALSELLPRFEHLLAALQSYRPAQAERDGYNFSVSAGVYPIERTEAGVDTMVNRARIPQKRVKGRAASSYAVYTHTLHEELLRNKALQSRFHAALQNRDLQVYYQPKYDLARGCFYGAEALVRWQTPEGLLPPGAFVPVCEQNGDIVQLDLYMLERVCQDLCRWRDLGLAATPISVNVSHLQLLQPQFVPDYLAILQRYEVSPALIEVEFTETMMVQNAARMCSAAEELHAAQMHVLIDDFGSGYSSLSMLKNVPIDVIKLDGSFMTDLEKDKKARDIVLGGLALAHMLGMTVTAECVETRKQFEFLKAAGCDMIQGFYCAKPMPCAQYELILSKPCDAQPF